MTSFESLDLAMPEVILVVYSWVKKFSSWLLSDWVEFLTVVTEHPEAVVFHIFKMSLPGQNGPQKRVKVENSWSSGSSRLCQGTVVSITEESSFHIWKKYKVKSRRNSFFILVFCFERMKNRWMPLQLLIYFSSFIQQTFIEHLSCAETYVRPWRQHWVITEQILFKSSLCVKHCSRNFMLISLICLLYLPRQITITISHCIDEKTDAQWD